MQRAPSKKPTLIGAVEKRLEVNLNGGETHPPHPGAQTHRYRCSLPDLAEFTAACRERTNAPAIDKEFDLLLIASETNAPPTIKAANAINKRAPSHIERHIKVIFCCLKH